MKTTLNHLKTCSSRLECPQRYCLSTRQILSHWKSCKNLVCPVCSSLRKVVPEYINTLVQNPPVRAELLRRFQWLFDFVGSPTLRSVQDLHQRELRRAETQGAKNAEE